MNGKTAALVLCVVCVILVGLLIGGAIRPVIGGGVFAAALVVLGLASGGFRGRRIER